MILSLSFVVPIFISKEGTLWRQSKNQTMKTSSFIPVAQ